MKATIFYAWQSWRDEQTNRYFIRDAAQRSIKDLRIGSGIELELDSDTQKEPGTPEIVNSILKKIDG